MKSKNARILSDVELRDFYTRYTMFVKKGIEQKTALYLACRLGQVQLFDLSLRAPWFVCKKALASFEGFLKMVEKGYLQIEDFEDNLIQEDEMENV